MKRTSGFTAAAGVNDFLCAINELVGRGESNFREPVEAECPVVLVVGAPRSGTTVLLQWLRAVGLAVPSNLAARFSANPLFAGMLQRLLTDPCLGFRDELSLGQQADGFASSFGKTVGLLAPHEFSFYFRQFFPVTVGEELAPEQLARCDTGGFLEGLRRFGGALGAPVAVKAMLIQYHLGLFLDHRRVVIIHTVRDEPDNVVSLLAHRSMVAGDLQEWISVRPPEYGWLRELSPIEQVAGQVHFTNQRIAAQLGAFPAERVVRLDHDEFCREPRQLHGQLREKFAAVGWPWHGEYDGPSEFKLRRYDPESEEYREAAAALLRVQERAAEKS
jgi:hypothetical protein